MQKGFFLASIFFFFFLLKRAKKVPKCRSSASGFAVSKDRQQRFPRGVRCVRGDWRLQEIPERAQNSGGDLRIFELWSAGIQTGAIHPGSAGDVRHTDSWGLGRRGDTGPKYRRDAYHCCTHTFVVSFFFQTLIFLAL